MKPSGKRKHSEEKAESDNTAEKERNSKKITLNGDSRGRRIAPKSDNRTIASSKKQRKSRNLDAESRKSSHRDTGTLRRLSKSSNRPAAPTHKNRVPSSAIATTMACHSAADVSQAFSPSPSQSESSVLSSKGSSEGSLEKIERARAALREKGFSEDKINSFIPLPLEKTKPEWKKTFSEMTEVDLFRLPIKSRKGVHVVPGEPVKIRERFYPYLKELQACFLPNNEAASKIYLNHYLVEALHHFIRKQDDGEFSPLSVVLDYSVQDKNGQISGKLDYVVVNHYKGPTGNEEVAVIMEAKWNDRFDLCLPSLISQLYAIFTNFLEPRPVYGILHGINLFLFVKFFKDLTWQRSKVFRTGNEDPEIIGNLVYIFGR